ncbi:hypothetical protein BGX34_007232, partial [Mortierella sp. NVP85]
MRKTPNDKAAAAIVLLRLGHSTRYVAQELNISKTTVIKFRSMDKENIPNNPGGRPRKMNDELVKHLKLNLKRGVLRTAVDAAKEANRILPDPVSKHTVARRLVEVQMKFKRKQKQPFLKQVHRRARMKFVNRYKQWT